MSPSTPSERWWKQPSWPGFWGSRRQPNAISVWHGNWQVPLVQHVFGIQADALHKTVVFDPHPPKGWEDMSIEDLPVGTNLISLSRARTGQGIQYTIEARQSGWSFVLKGNPLPGAKYYLNGSPVSFTPSGIRMSGRKNRVLVVPR